MSKIRGGGVNALPTFDFVFSLGAACLSTQSLRKADLQFASYPFDWLAGGNICKRAEIISSDFSSFMQFIFYSVYWRWNRFVNK